MDNIRNEKGAYLPGLSASEPLSIYNYNTTKEEIQVQKGINNIQTGINHIQTGINNIIENEKDLFEKARVFIVDTEILNDYFSFQFKLLDKDCELMNHKHIKVIDNVYIFECFNDEDCKAFYDFYTSQIMKENTFLYVYNKSFDKSILSIFMNLVLEKETNILAKLKRASNYLVLNNVDYSKVCKIHWQVIFDEDISRSVKEKTILKTLKHEPSIKFYEEFKHCLKNKAEKKKLLNQNTKVISILDIPRSNVKNLCSGKKNGTDLPIGLKTLQLALFDKKVSFDFDHNTAIIQIKKDNMYDTWLKYGANDVITAEKVFNMFVKDDIVNRFYAIKAVNESKQFPFNLNAIFSESNTKIINYLFGIEDKKEPDFNYCDYIQSENDDFNTFVEFVNNDKNITGPELKNKYKGNTAINLNGCECDISLGGIHGAINKYINKDNNIYDCDYASLYPNIIIKFKELFKNIMDVDLYENVKNMRIKYKKMSKDKSYTEDQRKEYTNIQQGLKLLLNSTFGIINSVYGGIAYKPLGLFICLYGQATAIKMVLHDKDCKPVNVNTDGVYFEIPENKDIKKMITELTEITGIDLEAEHFKVLIQKDVNNYIAINEWGEVRKKGIFNVSFKQEINTCTKPISVNMRNAIKLIENKQVEIEPIYFKNMLDLTDKAYYFTSSNTGKPLIKDLTKPVTYLLEGKQVFVTNDINKSDSTLYKEYAQITLNKIYAFDTNLESKKYFEYEIEEDTKENNNIKAKNITRIKKLLDCDISQIGYSGFMGNLKSNTYVNGKPIQRLINYNKSELLKSTETKGLIVNASNKLVIVDVDIIDKTTGKPKQSIDWEVIDKLKEIATYKTFNSVTKQHNFKLIFKNDLNKIFSLKENYKNYIEILDNAVVWTLDNPVRTYLDNDKEAVNISSYTAIFDGILEVKNDNAIEYINEKQRQNYVNENTNKEIQTSAAIELMNKHGVDIYKVENGNLHIACPYCQHFNKSHYENNKGTTDAYVNINVVDTGKGFKLHIHNLSNNCQNNTEHLEFYKRLNEEFINLLPSIEELKQEQLRKELSENIDINALSKLDEELLIPNTLRIVGTGGHKTFQSARKLIENVLVKKIFHIHSTKENKHIEDFEREVKKILRMVLVTTTHNIDEYLENDNNGLKEIGIHKLMTTNQIKTTNNLVGVVTNHSYWYKNGHTSNQNRNMSKIIEYINENKLPHEIVIDEYESFRKCGIIHIQLNKYMSYKLDYDNKDRKIWIPSPSCLYPALRPIVTKCNLSPLLFAEEYTTSELVEYNGIHTYKMDLNGGKDLQKQIDKYLKADSITLCDVGRRKAKRVVKNNLDYGYIIMDKVTQYKVTDIPDNEIGKMDFLKLLNGSRAIAIIRKVLKVGKMGKDTDIDINTWGTEINDLKELKKYGEELIKNNINFDKFKDGLESECGSELFINKLQIYTNPSIDDLSGTKYYLTANKPKNKDIPVNTELEHKSSNCLKHVDVCIIPKVKKGDDLILHNLDLLKERKFKSLAFTSLAKKINDLLHSGIDTKHWRVRTVINDGVEKSKTISYDTDDREEIDDNIIKTVTVAYINGTESQGRSFSQCELMLINTMVQVNIDGRVDIDENDRIFINSIEKETQEKLKQSIGRIFRGDQVYKSVIMFGDPGEIKAVFDTYPKNFTVKFNVETYVKQLQRKSDTRRALSDIINYYEYKLGYSEEVQHFNIHNRKTADNKRNTKYEDKEIYDYYMTRLADHYKEHKKKLKDTEVLPDIKEQFGIAPRQFKNIKKKFKES